MLARVADQVGKKSAAFVSFEHGHCGSGAFLLRLLKTYQHLVAGEIWIVPDQKSLLLQVS